MSFVCYMAVGLIVLFGMEMAFHLQAQALAKFIYSCYKLTCAFLTAVKTNSREDQFMLSSLRDRVRNTRLSRVELSLILILLLFGVPMIVLIPPGAGYDEEDHLVRVWELAKFSLIPGKLSPQDLNYPIVFRDMAYRQQGSAGILDSDFWQTYSRAALDERGFVRREIDTKSVYSPALLLPQAVMMGLAGRLADLPALTVFYLCRLAGLLSYLVLAWLAIGLIPFGKWLLFILAASPMALFQAATLSPDAISNGIGFLFIAECLRLAEVEKIGRRELGGLIILVFLLFLAKLNLLPLILLALLLFTPAKFAEKRTYTFLLAGIAILFLLEVAGWNWIASRNFNALLLDQANPRAQVLHVLGYPLTFLLTVLKDFFRNGFVYFQGWINGYGYYYWTPPALISVFYVLSLGFVFFMESAPQQVNRKLRIILAIVFVAGYILTIVSLYVSFAPVGSDQVFGVQGRYFIPLALPLFLVISSFAWSRKPIVFSSTWTMFFLALALSLNLLGLYFSFHVPCGATFYQTGLCYRPLFKDFPGEVRASDPVSDGLFLTQEFEVTCDGLSEVRVLLRPSRTDDLGITRFILGEASSERPLLDKSIANGPIRVETWYPLRFEPDWHSAGKQYTLEILGTSPVPDHGLQFFLTPQPEFNLGNSYENGELLGEDLVLQYGCTTGLRKIWLIGRP